MYMKNKIQRLVTVIFLMAISFVGSSQVAFPLKWSSNSRYMVDQNNVPFPILGRTAWFIISQPVSDYKTFISNSVSHGYNSFEMHVLDHDSRGYSPPFNGNGDLPFLKQLNGSNWDGSLSYSNINHEAPDLNTPNEAYWQFVDSFLSYCDSIGIVVFFFPAYLGYAGGSQGWMQELLANDTAKTRAYGAWIANRYRNQKNLVWMLLGDMGSFTNSEINAEAALIAGLKSVPGQQSTQYSAEANSGQNSADQPDFGDEMTFNGTYSFSGDVAALGRSAYSHNPVLPAFLLEEPYDEEGPDGNSVNSSATQPVRRFQWWGFLSDIGGYISGNGYVWPFVAPDWQNHLNTQGAYDMERLNVFIKSISWWDLVPSGLNGMPNLITAGGSTPSSSHYVAAAATPDGSLLVAYLPPAHNANITVQMTVMSDTAQARWFDPTSGVYTMISGSPFPNTGTHQFTTPGTNSSGKKDWVLVLNASSGAGCTAPAPVATTMITATSAKAKWSITGTPTGFDVRYKLTSSSTWKHKSITIATKTSVKLTNLQPSSDYEWQISATCGVESSDYSFSKFFTTLPMKAGESATIENNILIFPNPFNESASITFNDELAGNAEFILSDVFGREVMAIENVSNHKVISRGNLSSGIYFYRVTSGSKVISYGKLVIE